MNQKGVSIAAVVFLIVIISFMGVIFVSLLSTGVEESVVEYDSSRAFYIAEGGAEAALGHLTSPAAYCGGNCWSWNDGYLNRALGDGTIDVEVLQYESWDESTASSAICKTFTNTLKTVAVGTNQARTIYITLLTAPSNPNNLTLELYNSNAGTCATPTGTLVASSTTNNNPEIIRYRMTEAAGGPYTYMARITGNATGGQYYISISHPDGSGFTSSSWRSIISLGKMNNARREVFKAFRK